MSTIIQHSLFLVYFFSIHPKYGTVAEIDKYVNGDIKGTTGARAKRLDEKLESMGLDGEEYEAAKSYIGLKKLTLASKDNGKNSIVKELTQPFAYFGTKMLDSARSVTDFIKNGGKIDGEYSERMAELDAYYRENPDELGNDLFKDRTFKVKTNNGKEMEISDTYFDAARSDYLDNVSLEKVMEYYNSTTPVTHFIAEAGFGSAGQMLGAAAAAGLFGIPPAGKAAGSVANAIGKTKAGSKAISAASKLVAAAPKIKNAAGTGISAKVANKVIGKANKTSLKTVAKFLNPADNPTTAVMGLGAAQDKYVSLRSMGYSKEASKANALFTGYVSAVTEKMGYDGTPDKIFTINGKTISGAASASKLKNSASILKKYTYANISEGLEEIYSAVFERAGEYFSKIGYEDENGNIQYRKFVGENGVIDARNIAESFLGGFIGGAVMGMGTIVESAKYTNSKGAAEANNAIIGEIEMANEVIKEVAAEAGIESVDLPDKPDGAKATVEETIKYAEKSQQAYAELLSDERVIEHDKKIISEASEAFDNYTSELEEIMDAEPLSVKVGDTFKDKKTGNTITVIERNAENTVVQIDTGAKTETREFTNSQADTLAVNEQYEQVESTDTTSVTDITLTRAGDFYEVYGNDAAEIANKLNLTPATKTINGVKVQMVGFPVSSLDRYKSILGSNYNISVSDTPSVTSINEQNMPVSTENTPANGNVTNTDVSLSESKSMYEIMDELGLTYDEKRAILEYKSSRSYTFNEKLRNGESLTEAEAKLKNDLNSVLDKIPAYKGIVYRSIGFKTKEEFDDFISKHENREVVKYADFTSCSKETERYVISAEYNIYNVYYEILSENAKDVEQIGLTEEREVLFKTDTEFAVAEVAADSESVYIKLKELTGDGTDKNNRADKNNRNGQNAERGSSEARINGLYEEIYTENDILRERSTTDDRISESQSDRSRGRGSDNIA